MQACYIWRLLRKAIFDPILIKFKTLLSLRSKTGVSSKHLQTQRLFWNFIYLFFVSGAFVWLKGGPILTSSLFSPIRNAFSLQRPSNSHKKCKLLPGIEITSWFIFQSSHITQFSSLISTLYACEIAELNCSNIFPLHLLDRKYLSRTNCKPMWCRIRRSYGYMPSLPLWIWSQIFCHMIL